VRIVFQGSSSPDVYGVSLEGESGIVLDNIAMRGASGVIFSRLDRNSTSAMLRSEPVGLVLLQYGGNTVPYIKDEKHAQQYAARLARQIRLLKLWLPQASFVLIGPSDMSKKEGTDYVTYDAVPWVRDALKNMSMKEEIGFWDIYGAMGGRNSMPQWVNADPPLAGADHIHFTPKGAKQIAEWLFTAFDEVINPKEEMNEEMKSAEDES
jgi:lysophospholipase L1-like esterase